MAVLLVVVMKLFNLADFLAGGASKLGDAGRFWGAEGQSVVCISGDDRNDEDSVESSAVHYLWCCSIRATMPCISFPHDLHFARHLCFPIDVDTIW